MNLTYYVSWLHMQFYFPEDALVNGFDIIIYTHICQNLKRNMCSIEPWNASAQGTCSSGKVVCCGDNGP